MTAAYAANTPVQVLEHDPLPKVPAQPAPQPEKPKPEKPAPEPEAPTKKDKSHLPW